jgi:5-methyltetrahydrofolate--homocysteine methyltransferase
MGTMLMNRGMPRGACPERWAAQHPRILREIHREYVLAGSDVVLSCTFGGTAARLGEPPERLNFILADHLLKAVGDDAVPGASMGPTGKLLHPLGSLCWIDAYGEFLAQARALARAGMEVFFLETFSDPRELKAAALAVRDACPHGFISAQMSFNEGGRSMAGTPPEALAVLAEQLPVDAAGANCSAGPWSLVPVTKVMAACTSKPLTMEPNAGLPDSGGLHRMSPESFASGCGDLVRAGASIVGGCCGTRPDHIGALRSLAGSWNPPGPGRRTRALSSVSEVVPLDDRLNIVGEGINPSGRSGLASAIRRGDTGYVLSLAAEQRRAAVLDVNLGLERMIPSGFVSGLFSRLAYGPPVSVDLSSPECLEEAFRELGGVGLLNSITCDPGNMAPRVEILRRHGGLAVLLPMDSRGIGETPRERVAMIRRGMSLLGEMGLPAWRIAADPVVGSMASGADPSVTLKTLGMMKRLGWLTIAGVSNASHGLPDRRAVNLAFLAALAGKGLNLAIADAVSDELPMAARDGRALAGLTRAMPSEPVRDDPGFPSGSMEAAIFAGNPEETVAIARKLLKEGAQPGELAGVRLKNAMDSLGTMFEKRRIFLPRLIACAEAAKALTDLLRPLMKGDGTAGRGTVVLATVQGDRHDIGKNLAALFMEGAGFRVVDLGRDVSSGRILEAVLREKPLAVALSALMSGAAVRMAEVTELLRSSGVTVPVIVGGAVVDREYAQSLGALYSKDACGVVRLLKELVRGAGDPPPVSTGIDPDPPFPRR